MNSNTLLTMQPIKAVATAGVLVALLGLTMIAWSWVPHLSLLVVIVALLFFGLLNKIKFEQMQACMIGSVGSAMGAIYLFSFIGLLVSALMMSGAIPTLIYYGFEILSAKVFYLSAFILSSVVGIALGSGFTTCATVGVAFLGMATALGQILPSWLVLSSLVRYLVIRCHLYPIQRVSPPRLLALIYSTTLKI